ncbi:MAG: hypothetical protein QNL04_11015 [SAR324 cluster bacterium]|nr:hypothetical protein [SAR324 cluster bacterium]
MKTISLHQLDDLSKNQILAFAAMLAIVVIFTSVYLGVTSPADEIAKTNPKLSVPIQEPIAEASKVEKKKDLKVAKPPMAPKVKSLSKKPTVLAKKQEAATKRKEALKDQSSIKNDKKGSKASQPARPKRKGPVAVAKKEKATKSYPAETTQGALFARNLPSQDLQNAQKEISKAQVSPAEVSRIRKSNAVDASTLDHIKEMLESE